MFGEFISYYSNKYSQSPQTYCISDIPKLLASGTTQQIINKFNAGKIEKDCLPIIRPSALMREGVKEFENVIEHSGYIYLDIDTEKNPDRDFIQLQGALNKDCYTYMSWKSPRGGLRVLVSVGSNITIGNHLDYWKDIVYYYQHKYKIVVDKRPKAVNANCFLSYDPNPYECIYRHNYDKIMFRHRWGHSNKPKNEILHNNMMLYALYGFDFRTDDSAALLGLKDDDDIPPSDTFSKNKKYILTSDTNAPGPDTFSKDKKSKPTLPGSDTNEPGSDTFSTKDQIPGSDTFSTKDQIPGSDTDIPTTDTFLHNTVDYSLVPFTGKIIYRTPVDQSIFIEGENGKYISGGYDFAEVRLHKSRVIPEGCRTSTLGRDSMTLIWLNPSIPLQALINCMQRINRLFCSKPLTAKEVRNICKSNFERHTKGKLNFKCVIEHKKVAFRHGYVPALTSEQQSKLSLLPMHDNELKLRFLRENKHNEAMMLIKQGKQDEYRNNIDLAIAALKTNGSKVTYKQIADYLNVTEVTIKRRITPEQKEHTRKVS